MMGRIPCNPGYTSIKQPHYCLTCRKLHPWVRKKDSDMSLSLGMRRCDGCNSAHVVPREKVLMKGDKLECNERIICDSCANWEALNPQFIAGKLLAECFLDEQGCTICDICRVYLHLASGVKVGVGKMRKVEYRAITIPNNLATITGDGLSVDIAHI